MTTYTLKGQQDHSTGYYRQISLFADRVLARGEDLLSELVTRFLQSALGKDLIQADNKPSREECLLELLTLGVLWREYQNQAMAFFPGWSGVFHGLIGLRQGPDRIKALADSLRGKLATLLLFRPQAQGVQGPVKPRQINRLLVWLAATNEFRETTAVLKAWQQFFQELPPEKSEPALEQVLAFALWFQRESQRELGQYTEQVAPFRSRVYAKRAYRENLIFCHRAEVEYHLNMVGAEVMNRDLREPFLATGQKQLLLPICMRLAGEGGCRAEKTSRGLQCRHCHTRCQVSRLTRMGREIDLQVLLIPHGSRIFPTAKEREAGTGIVGVACVLNLLEGGWQAKRLGYVPQCVILEACGCKKHWCDQDQVTSIDESQLAQVLQKKAEILQSNQ